MKANLADGIVKHLSTWRFLVGSSILVLVWCVGGALLGATAFDPYPYIFLNLIVSLWAMVQNQLIMISQYKLAEGDRQLAKDNHEDTKKILEHIALLEKNLIKEVGEAVVDITEAVEEASDTPENKNG